MGCSLCGVATGAAFTCRVQVAGTCSLKQGVECRVCGDACDARALRFVPARGGIAQMQVVIAVCTGCDDCVAPCPVAAISVA